MKIESKKNGLQMKILQTAIRLFNEEGYASVSIRDISNKLNISPGNLTYHYKKKNDLIRAIFDLLYMEYKKMNLIPCMDIQELGMIFDEIIHFQKKYSFYFQNIIEIPRLYPELSDLQSKVFIEFKELFKNSLMNLNQQGMVRNELEKDGYDDLASAILSVALFWNQHNVFEETFLKKGIIHVLWSVILPNLTEQGLEMYKKLNQQ